ncbi:MAG: FAD:protein FMN transferase [Gaiellales bacterium]
MNSDCDPLPGHQAVEQIMGMPIIVDVRDDVDRRAMTRVFDWFRAVDRTFSTYKPDSVISRLDSGALDPTEAPAAVREVLELCEHARKTTLGYFDVRATGRLDPSGLVKGWAVDRAARLLEEEGAANYTISAGGDLVAKGDALPGGGWRIGLQHPLDERSLMWSFDTTDASVATSGAYVRGQHVLDPHSQRPPTGLLSVTIAGPELATADIYATAAFAMGEAATRWVTTLAPYEALVVDDDERVLTTPGFPAADRGIVELV